MQTFLPYSSYERSAQVLDTVRLSNQCLRECRTLINGGWLTHPASRMWHGFDSALARYSIACLNELARRRPNSYIGDHIAYFTAFIDSDESPPWLGDERVHSSHRANLLRKDPSHYGQFGWTESPALEYWWPVS